MLFVLASIIAAEPELTLLCNSFATAVNARSDASPGSWSSSAAPTGADYSPPDKDYQALFDEGSRANPASLSPQRDAPSGPDFAPPSAQDDRGAGFDSDSLAGDSSSYGSSSADRPNALDDAASVHTDSDADGPASVSGGLTARDGGGPAGQDSILNGPSGHSQDARTLSDDELDRQPDQPDPVAGRDYADSSASRLLPVRWL